MLTPEFLTRDEVLEIHQNQIELYGGSFGIRDHGLLEAALAQPETSFDGHYLHPDPFMMAAAYVFHIVQYHPFVDGNKRAGTVAAVIFLSINDILLSEKIDKISKTTNKTEFELLVLEVASGKINKIQIAEFFKLHCEHKIQK